MTDDKVHFDDTSRAGILDYFENTLPGNQIVYDIANNFATATQAINHIQPAGDASILHLLTGDTVTFDNLPKPRLARIARAVTAYFGLRQ